MYSHIYMEQGYKLNPAKEQNPALHLEKQVRNLPHLLVSGSERWCKVPWKSVRRLETEIREGLSLGTCGKAKRIHLLMVTQER